MKREGINWTIDDRGWCYNKIHVHGYSREELERMLLMPVSEVEDLILTDMGDYGQCIRCGYGLYRVHVYLNETEEDEPHIVLTIGKSCD